MTGAEFKAALKEAGFTQTSFARHIGMAVNTVNTWTKKGPPLVAIRVLEQASQSEPA